jgi:hypothetical protein
MAQYGMEGWQHSCSLHWDLGLRVPCCEPAGRAGVASWPVYLVPWWSTPAHTLHSGQQVLACMHASRHALALCGSNPAFSVAALVILQKV